MTAAKKAELETAQHIHDSVQALAKQAAASKFETLACLLSMAEMEAARYLSETAGDRRKPRSAA